MQSDTIIGIVGAVVLVAVMVGVFAYEYNNAPEGMGTDPESREARMMSFNETFSGLDGMDDIDDDEVPNWQDDDIDGDGVSNQNDTDVMYMADIQGDVGARVATTNPAHTANTFVVGNGMLEGSVELTWSTTGPTNLGELVVSITGEEESIVCDNQPTGSATCDLAGALPGKYTIEVRQAANNPQANSYTGSIHIVYPSPEIA